jgi:glucan phosphoethanolaminetransferase (alkaline phosphatase superfamily)
MGESWIEWRDVLCTCLIGHFFRLLLFCFFLFIFSLTLSFCPSVLRYFSPYLSIFSCDSTYPIDHL